MPEQLVTIGLEFWNTLGEMAPYLLFGFLVAGALSVLVRPEAIERHLGGRGIWPVVKASIFGVPLPLCSCSVIPVGASLRKHGATNGATTAFLISTPQTGVDSIFVTFSLLGPVFAVFRPIVALVSGLIGGFIATFVDSNGEKHAETIPHCEDECCSGDNGGSKFLRAIRYGFVALPRDIGKSLVVGLLIAGAISAIVPDDFFTGVLGTGIGAMIVMMFLGIPIYVCATASVPVAAALMLKGVSPGAALVFLMTGPATNAAAVTTIWKIMGKRSVAIYLGTVALTALGSGILLDYIYTTGHISAMSEMHWMLPGYIKMASALVLLVVLVKAMLPRAPERLSVPVLDEEAQTATLLVTGMTCAHCAQSVKRALRECIGVDSVEVDSRSGTAVIRGRNFDMPSLRHAVEGLGYNTASGDHITSIPKNEKE
ncbi:MAG: SO_0444 family Cu/Zn efflux transporter [bacterium]